MQWDEYKIRTSPRVPRGTIVMHPEDAKQMRSLDAIIDRETRNHRLPPAMKWPHLYNGDGSRQDDDARKAELRKMVDDELARRAGE